MNEITLIATVSTYYVQLERRIEGAANLASADVRRMLAETAFAIVLQGAEESARPALEKQADAVIAAVVAQRDQIGIATHELGRRLPRSVFLGPINAVFVPARRVNMVMVAEEGPIGDYAYSVRNAVHGGVPFLDPAKTTWDDLTARNALIYGTPQTMPLVADVLSQAGWTVAADKIAIGSRVFEGENLVLIAARLRPSDGTLVDLVYTSHDAESLVGINLLHHGPSDFVIGRRTKPGRYQIVTRGNFAKGSHNEPLTVLAS